MCLRTLDFSWWQKTSIAVGQPSTGHKQKGIGEGEEDVQISDYRVWTETVKSKQQTYKEKS